MNSPQRYSYSLAIAADPSQVYRAWQNPEARLTHLLGRESSGARIKVTSRIEGRRIDFVAWSGPELLFRGALELDNVEAGTDARLSVVSLDPRPLGERLQTLTGRFPLEALHQDLHALKHDITRAPALAA